MRKLILIPVILEFIGMGIYSLSVSKPEKFPTYLAGDYPGFTTIADMEKYVDSVLIAKIDKVHPSFLRKEKEVEDLNLIETDSEIIIEKVKKGNNNPNGKFVIKQDGGEVNGKKQLWEGVTYFKPTITFNGQEINVSEIVK